MENRKFNNNSKKFDNKSFPIIIIGYIILIIFCIVNFILYFYNIHNNVDLIILFSFFPTFLSWLYWIIKIIITRPDGDLEYMFSYYPEIYKYLFYIRAVVMVTHVFRRTKSIFVWNDFKNGYLTKFGEDKIIDDMCDRWKKRWNLMLCWPIIFWIINVIFIIIAIDYKHGF